MSKVQKTISTATAAAFLVVAIAQPIASAAESGNMIDKSQQEVQAAQQQQSPEYIKMQQEQAQQIQQIQQVQQQQQNFQTYLSPSGTVSQSRQTIYDTATGQLITLVQNSTGQVFAYTQSGQQVAVQQAWLNNISFPQTTVYSPTVGINGNVSAGSVDSGTASISQSKAAQLSAVLSAIKADGNLNAVGKIAKALLALEAIKENNQIVRQQYLAQQKAKAQAQAEQEKKVQQAAQQPKAAVQQKQSAPANAKKGEPAEYGSYLRDTESDTGGTATKVELGVSPNADTQQSTELPLHLDLIGKVAGVAGDTVTLQDAKGQQIDVDAPESTLQQGDYVNVQGTALNGADGNIYIVKDPESGMDIELNTITEEDYNQKAAEQEQAAQDFAAEYPYAASISVDPPAQEDITDADYAAQYAEYKEIAPEGAFSPTKGEMASIGLGLAGAGMVAAGIAGVAFSYGTLIVPSSALITTGAGMVASAIGTYVVQDFYQAAQEAVEERHTDPFANGVNGNDIREKANALQQEVDSNM